MLKWLKSAEWLTSPIGLVAAALTLVTSVGASVVYVDDRYEHRASAEQRHLDTRAEFKKQAIREYEREKFQLMFAQSQGRKLSAIEQDRLNSVQSEIMRLNKELTILQKQLTP